MHKRLDDLLAELKAVPLDRSLVNLEAELHLAIDTHPARTGLFAPWRAATVAVALFVGVSVGGMTAAVAAPRTAALSVGEELAPSTLLEGME